MDNNRYIVELMNELAPLKRTFVPKKLTPLMVTNMSDETVVVILKNIPPSTYRRFGIQKTRTLSASPRARRAFLAQLAADILVEEAAD